MKKENSESIKAMEKLLLNGEPVPASWESGGYDLTKWKIQDLNKTIRALKRGRTYKSYQERIKMTKLEKEREKAAYRVKVWKPVSDFQLNKVLGSTPVKPQINLFESSTHTKNVKIDDIVRERDERISFRDAVRDVIIHRRQMKIKSTAFISMLPETLKERKIMALRNFMTHLYDNLQTLFNMRNKDLKSKAPISTAALRVLKQDFVVVNHTPTTRQNSGESSIKSWEEMLNWKSNDSYAVTPKKEGSNMCIPIWQILAAEYMDNKSWVSPYAATTSSPPKDTLVDRMVLGWNQVRAKQARETEYAIKTIERKNAERFRVQNIFLNQRHISFEYFHKKVKAALPEVRIQLRDEKDIEKVSWLYDLDDLCQNYRDADPTIKFPELKRLQKFFTIDIQEIPFVKAKLCHYVMSVPAYEILRNEIQKSLVSTLAILFLPQSLLKEWLSIRHLPLLIHS